MTERARTNEQQGQNEIDLLRGAVLAAYSRLGLSAIDYCKINPRNPELSELVIQRKGPLITIKADTDSQTFESSDELCITRATQHEFYLYEDGSALLNTHGRIHTTHPSNQDLRMEHMFHRDGNQVRTRPHEQLEARDAEVAAQLAAELAGMTVDRIVKDSLKAHESKIYFETEAYESTEAVLEFVRQAAGEQAEVGDDSSVTDTAYREKMDAHWERHKEEYYGDPVKIEDITRDPELVTLFNYLTETRDKELAGLDLDLDPEAGFGLYFKIDHPLFFELYLQSRGDNRQLFDVGLAARQELRENFLPGVPFKPLQEYLVGARRSITISASAEGLRISAYDELESDDKYREGIETHELDDNNEVFTLQSRAEVPDWVVEMLRTVIYAVKRIKAEDLIEDKTFS